MLTSGNTNYTQPCVNSRDFSSVSFWWFLPQPCFFVLLLLLLLGFFFYCSFVCLFFHIYTSYNLLKI